MWKKITKISEGDRTYGHTKGHTELKVMPTFKKGKPNNIALHWGILGEIFFNRMQEGNLAQISAKKAIGVDALFNFKSLPI